MESAKRPSPIGAEAKAFLLDLIKQEKVLHNKGTDGRMAVLKKEAWTRVAQKFNASGLSEEKKTGYQLLKVWERVKGKAKKENTAFKREPRKTDGGVPLPLLDDTTKTLTIKGSDAPNLGCPFDSDSGPRDCETAPPITSNDTSVTLSLDEVEATSSGAEEPTLPPLGSAQTPQESSPKDLFTVSSKKKKRKLSDDHPATLHLSEGQKLLLDEQLKVVKLQQEVEKARIEEHVRLFKQQQEWERERHTAQLNFMKLQQEEEKLKILLVKQQLEGERERNAEEVKLSRLLQEREKLKICLSKQQFKRAQEGTLILQSTHEEWV